MATRWVPTAVAVALVAASLLAAPGAAQSPPNPPDCVSKLIPCAKYMNGTDTPPDTCCGPLRDAVQNDLTCLCKLYAEPEIFRVFNVNLTDALRLSKRCGLSDTTSKCSGGNNASHGTISAGSPGLMSLFLVLWSVLA